MTPDNQNDNSTDSSDKTTKEINLGAQPTGPSLFPETPQGDDSAGWLISYADMMTLIACFFILMMAFANYDPQAFSRKSQELAKHFSGDKEHLKESEDQLTQLIKEIKANDKLDKETDIKVDNEGLTLTFSGSALFASGQAHLRPEIIETLDVMIDLIRQKNSSFRIMVEGHTDDAPMRNSSRYDSNWELSGARASRIVERFEGSGFNKEQLVSIGYGDTRPVVENRDSQGIAIPENMSQNRRVIIKVLEPLAKIVKERYGLGVYFDSDDFGEKEANKKAVDPEITPLPEDDLVPLPAE